MKLEKIKDWCDDICYEIRHTKGNINAFFHSIGRWFSYYKVLKTAYDFDWESIIMVEKHQITRVRDTITKYHNHIDWKQDVRWMNVALKLLEIIEENGCSELKGQCFETELYKDGLYKLVDNPNSKWVMPIYVNTTNSQRFSKIDKDKFQDPKIGPLMKDHLRVEKAWYLYNKLRTYYMWSWWD